MVCGGIGEGVGGSAAKVGRTLDHRVPGLEIGEGAGFDGLLGAAAGADNEVLVAVVGDTVGGD